MSATIKQIVEDAQHNERERRSKLEAESKARAKAETRKFASL